MFTFTFTKLKKIEPYELSFTCQTEHKDEEAFFRVDTRTGKVLEFATNRIDGVIGHYFEDITKKSMDLGLSETLSEMYQFTF